MKKTLLFLLLLLTIFLIASCGTKSGLTEKQDETAKDAIKELNKIKAATEIGINKVEYSKMLINAKSKVNQVSQDLPDGELKQTIENVMENYIDANSLWFENSSDTFVFVCSNKREIDGDDIMGNAVEKMRCNPTGQEILKKYKGIPTRNNDGKIQDVADGGINLIKEEGVAFIWNEAKKNTKNATSLLEK